MASQMAEDGDYLYKLLGCDELSSEEQIFAEYKIKAKALHPDKNSGNLETTEEFITLTKAKEILCDKERRKQYDSWRRSGLDIPFDTWCQKDQANRMSMHWAPQPKKKKMIESCKTPENSESLTNSNESSTSESLTNRNKNITWERKSSWGDPELSRFRNYRM